MSKRKADGEETRRSSDFASDDNIRCAQCTFVVLHIFTEMLQDLLADTHIPPSALKRMIKKSNIDIKKFERQTVKTMTTDGFAKLDISVMYKIIKHFNLIAVPTRNWGANPLPKEIELGDDIERIRNARNHLVHKWDANVSEKSFTEFFDSSITVSRRLDKYLKKTEGSTYEERIQQYRSCLLDQKNIEQLLEERQQQECLKHICTCSLECQTKEVHIMMGKTMDEVLERVKSIKDESVTPIKITIHGIEGSDDNVDLINSIKHELSSDNIIFKRAEKNCIILFADIKNKTLQNHTLFMKEVNCLISKVFRLRNLACEAGEIAHAVITSAEEEVDQDNLVGSEEGGPSLFGNDDSLALHIDIKNKVLSNETVEHVFTEFFDNVFRTGNGGNVLQKTTVQAVLIPELQDEELRKSNEKMGKLVLVKMNTRGQKKKRKSTTKTSPLEAATQEDTPPPMVTIVQDTVANIPSTSGAVMNPVVTNRQDEEFRKSNEKRRKLDEEVRKSNEQIRKLEEEFRRYRRMFRNQVEGFKRYTQRESLLQLLSQDLVPSFDSRILVVGAYEAGKTTLVSNLIGKAIPRERQCTDGIDVYFGKLLFDLKKQKLLKKTKGVHRFPKAIYQKILSYRNSVKNEDVIPGKTQPDVPIDDVLQELSVKIQEYEDAESTQLNVDQEVIPIPVLDFAGQIVYHATHQTFITSHGIYIITFNGSKELDDPLSDREDERKTTILENIRQWVSSILLYSHPDNKDYPKLMFVATHKDLVCQQDVSNKRAHLLNTLSACFTDENIQSHIMLQHLFFVNALNENDPEMEELRECISKTITENPQWGQKVPKQFLILEMMFAALVEQGKIIITLEDAEKINTTTGIKPLSTAELGLFLGVQNICGKMTYIDYPQLRNYIVIDPTCLIDVLKSIVTSVPIIASLHQGRLTKSELTNIWSSEKFSHFLQHVEYFRQLLVHYDILSEVRRYDRESGKKISVDCYLVPCMITTQNTTTFVAKLLTSDKCVGFVFEFSATDVPDAIPCRLIASILSIWNVKNYENVDLLFSGFVAVVLDRKHDLVVKTERNTVAVYIVHKERKELIIKDLASCVRECLEQNLAKISEVYSLSFTSDNITKRYVPFDVKLKSGCLAPNCLLDAENVHSIDTSWVCDNHGYVTPKSELEIWYTDRTTLQCTDSCQGILDAVLSMLLNDSQLLRICNSLTKEEVRSLAFNLGVSNTKLDAIDSDSISIIKFYSLRICKEKNKSCKDFVKAMEAAEINRHTMCQILRQEEVETDLPDTILNLPPSDEMLDKLCLRIGKEWMVLGLELGLEIERLEQIEYDNPKVLREVSRQMLYCWKNRDDDSTIRELLHALERSGRNPLLITEILENCESYPKLIPVD